LKAFRILSILLAVFILAGMVASLLRLHEPPRFHRTPTFFVQRVVVPAIAALLLLMNPKRLKTAGERFCYLATLFGISVWYSVQELRYFFLFFDRVLPLPVYGILALDWVVVAVLWGTFWITSNQYLSTKAKSHS